MDQAGAIGVKTTAAEAKPASKAYAAYALGLLMLTYAMNYVDRKILAILLEPIKRDLHLSDTYLGFLTGFSFALFYATLGVPIAMLADRSSRRNIIAVSLVVFSGFTLVCGLVANFWQLVLARIAVGAGEAGTSPASHSMIADTAPPERRAQAMGIYALGVPLGTMIAFLVGGWIAERYGWRGAFFAAAVPGLFIALLVRFTLREPVRGGADGLKVEGESPGVMESFRHLWSIRSYRHIVLGTSLAVFASHGISTWAPSFLARSFAMGTADIGMALALIFGIGGGLGVVGTGMLCDRLGRRDLRWNMWLLCIIQVVCFPLVLSFYFSTSNVVGLALFLIPAAFGSSYIGATLAMNQALAPVRMRALASSFYLLIVNLVGQGLGPQVIGILSDLYRPSLGEESLRYALMSVSVAWLWSAVHFALAARTLRHDVETARVRNASQQGR